MKDAFDKIINDLIASECGDLQKAFDKIINDFIASECRTFGEYFSLKETEFMDNTVTGRLTPYYTDSSFDKTPSAMIREFFDIPQYYLCYVPRIHGGRFLALRIMQKKKLHIERRKR